MGWRAEKVFSPIICILRNSTAFLDGGVTVLIRGDCSIIARACFFWWEKKQTVSFLMHRIHRFVLVILTSFYFSLFHL